MAHHGTLWDGWYTKYGKVVHTRTHLYKYCFRSASGIRKPICGGNRECTCGWTCTCIKLLKSIDQPLYVIRRPLLRISWCCAGNRKASRIPPSNHIRAANTYSSLLYRIGVGQAVRRGSPCYTFCRRTMMGAGWRRSSLRAWATGCCALYRRTRSRGAFGTRRGPRCRICTNRAYLTRCFTCGSICPSDAWGTQ